MGSIALEVDKITTLQRSPKLKDGFKKNAQRILCKETPPKFKGYISKIQFLDFKI